MTESLVAERTVIRQYLVEYWEGEDDNSMAHAVIFAPSDFEAVRRTVSAFVQQVDWLQQQCDERAVLTAKLQTAESALDSAKQPLRVEMARLNKRIIELTAELDRLRQRPNARLSGGPQGPSA